MKPSGSHRGTRCPPCRPAFLAQLRHELLAHSHHTSLFLRHIPPALPGPAGPCQLICCTITCSCSNSCSVTTPQTQRQGLEEGGGQRDNPSPINKCTVQPMKPLRVPPSRHPVQTQTRSTRQGELEDQACPVSWFHLLCEIVCKRFWSPWDEPAAQDFACHSPGSQGTRLPDRRGEATLHLFPIPGVLPFRPRELPSVRQHWKPSLYLYAQM